MYTCLKKGKERNKYLQKPRLPTFFVHYYYYYYYTRFKHVKSFTKVKNLKCERSQSQEERTIV